jgi:5-methylcytosine-specific restriction endonuclease McrA
MSREIDNLLAGMLEIEKQLYDRLWVQAEKVGSILTEINPQKRKRLFKYDRDQMLMSQGRRCAEPSCGKILDPKDIHEDHIIPISYGGGNETSNLRLLCSRCNLTRGNEIYGYVEIKPLIEYYEDRVRNLSGPKALAYLLKSRE